MPAFSQSQRQSQVQKQSQKLSQKQIQAINFLGMKTADLREEVLKFVNENPAVEIVHKREKDSFTSKATADERQAAMENKEDREESLQTHLIHQLNLMNLSKDAYDICLSLIYNLDRNGCYGSMLAPETLLDKKNPRHTQKLLNQCIEIIQHLDPVGICCKNLEESLYIQAKISGNAPKLALFLLNGKLDFLNPPVPSTILRKLEEFQKNWHKKAFAPSIFLDEIKLTEESVIEAFSFIRTLNPHPAQGFTYDTTLSDYEIPDIVLSIKKEEGGLLSDDYDHGMIALDSNYHLKIEYTSGEIPQIRLSDLCNQKNLNEDMQKMIQQARDFIGNLQFRESTILFQGCAIAHAQKDFFVNGPGHLKSLTRREVASELGIHESTVSRVASKKNSRYFQTDWGILPASYFFTSGVGESKDKIISADFIKAKIKEYNVQFNDKPLSDSKLADLLHEDGIKIARRTVAKYREQLGLKNSYGK